MADNTMAKGQIGQTMKDNTMAKGQQDKQWQKIQWLKFLSLFVLLSFSHFFDCHCLSCSPLDIVLSVIVCPVLL
jgi:hypothetical protein